jgi:hypothetical protein
MRALRRSKTRDLSGIEENHSIHQLSQSGSIQLNPARLAFDWGSSISKMPEFADGSREPVLHVHQSPSLPRHMTTELFCTAVSHISSYPVTTAPLPTMASSRNVPILKEHPSVRVQTS